MFALDLVSNFLMQLVSKKHKFIRDNVNYSETVGRGDAWENDFIQKLANVLTEKKIGHTRSGVIITLAALLNHNIFPPEPENNGSGFGLTASSHGKEPGPAGATNIRQGSADRSASSC
jgi:hypothetical protein